MNRIPLFRVVFQFPLPHSHLEARYPNVKLSFCQKVDRKFCDVKRIDFMEGR